MNESLRHDQIQAQDKTTVEISSQEYSSIAAEDIRHNHPKKEKILKKEAKKENYKEVNEERKENISFNKNRNKQCSSTYEKENQKIENDNFSDIEDIKNKKVNKNKSTSKIALIRIQKKKKIISLI